MRLRISLNITQRFVVVYLDCQNIYIGFLSSDYCFIKSTAYFCFSPLPKTKHRELSIAQILLLSTVIFTKLRISWAHQCDFTWTAVTTKLFFQLMVPFFEQQYVLDIHKALALCIRYQCYFFSHLHSMSEYVFKFMPNKGKCILCSFIKHLLRIYLMPDNAVYWGC